MMGIREADFWESTPRKIIALIDQKKEIEKAKQRRNELAPIIIYSINENVFSLAKSSPTEYIMLSST